MAQIHSQHATYLSKDQLKEMIEQYTGKSASTLGYAIGAFGYKLCSNALKAKIPPVIVAWLGAITTVVAGAALLKDISTYTERQNFVGLLQNLVDNPRQYTRFKVVSTIWMEWHEGPTMGYYTYYTTVSYEAV
ncbi:MULTISPECIES: hypothetical protein [Paenibacillus]|jgi:predicted S18 family serine protease|uniref:Uncharacterized protein n=1 Tax=Paenibacillus polymyxa TaxID=1406 RepID=A0AAP4A033_PAEPO|nr:MULTISPECIES: hypothetical protein [Paenibacillus]APB77836.1 hypothetical protein PPYC2_24070 [Paenibacillus polymyxa]MDH2332862.1 hypothetical protein [Paenibacillus polymyxa]MXO76927.1 hypothetical protein [Paenibacillus sp. OT2-17]OMF69822.1 hypothetical protein BK143_19735 [Paenibacillus peoriae]OMF79059.1 hypothetical protein BK145_14395 [Paenibacillus peoriae]